MVHKNLLIADLATTVGLAPVTYVPNLLQLRYTNLGAALLIDSTALSVGTTILFKNQADGSQNGIYEVTSITPSGADFIYIFTRTTNFILNLCLTSVIYIKDGTLNISLFFGLCITDTVITIGQTNLVFVFLGSNSQTKIPQIIDTDMDTSVSVEQPIGTDTDTIVFRTSGVDRGRVVSTGDFQVDTDLDLTTVSNGSGRLLMGTTIVMHRSQTIANANFFVGDSAGNFALTGTNNTGLGRIAGFSLTTGLENTFLGDNSGALVDTGNFNTLVGKDSGRTLDAGSSNTLVGRNAGEFADTANNNVVVGADSGIALSSGSNNTFIGHDCGTFVLTGSDNVLLGKDAGTAATFSPAVGAASSDQLRIQNATDSLISGDFSAPSLGLHGDTTVNGFVNVTGVYQVSGTQVVTSQQGAIGALTDSSGGTDAGAGGTIAAITNAANAGSADVGPTQDAIATLAGQVERALAALRTHGLIA